MTAVHTVAIPQDWERAVAYGDGFFESIFVVDGKAPLWSLHRARLIDAVKRLRINCDINTIEDNFQQCSNQQSLAIVKIIVARAGGQRGYSPTNTDYSVSIKAYPAPQFSQQRIAQGLRLHLCRQCLSHNAALAGIKHLNRLEQVLAADELNKTLYDEGLMLDVQGSVIEGISSNLLVLQKNTLVTPSLKNCGVAGVMRAFILQKLAVEMGIAVEETRLTLQDCLNAEGMFICNSVIGVLPVQSIGISPVVQHTETTVRIWQTLSSLGYARLYV